MRCDGPVLAFEATLSLPKVCCWPAAPLPLPLAARRSARLANSGSSVASSAAGSTAVGSTGVLDSSAGFPADFLAGMAVPPEEFNDQHVMGSTRMGGADSSDEHGSKR